MTDLATIHEALWLYLTAPIIVLSAIYVTVRLRAPQITRIGQAFRALRETDPEAPGDVPSGTPAILATAASVGAAAAVGAATAVGLGGPGALFWVWVFAFLLAPLGYAEVVLARTNAPGKNDPEASGSLTRRLLHQGGASRTLGMVLLVLLAITGFAFVGGVHGGALTDASLALLPDGAAAVGYGVAGGAAALALLGLRRGGVVAGWLAAAALVTLAAACILAIVGAPGRAFGAIPRAVSEAFSGAPVAEPWVGAAVGEVFVAALLFAVPPLSAGTGVLGGLYGAARAQTTRRLAATALLGPFLYAIIATLLVMAFVGSGGYYHRADTSRPFSEIRVYGSPFTSQAERDDPGRLHTGYLRIVDGTARDLDLYFATDRGMVRDARFEFRGNPADVALHFTDGRIERMLRPRDGTLVEVDIDRELGDLVIKGRMLPEGGGLLASSFSRGSGADLAGRLALVALLLLLAVGAAAFGLALGRGLPAGAPTWAAPALSLLPAAGIAVAGAAIVPSFGLIGGLAAGLSSAAAAIAIAARAREAS